MKLRHLLLLVFLLILISSQQVFSNLDSLKSQYAVQTGKQQVETGLAIVESLSGDPENQLLFTKILLASAEKMVPDTKLLALVHHTVSDAYLSLDSFELSNIHLLAALEIAENLPEFDTIFIATICDELGNNYNELDNNFTAQKYLERSIALLEEAGITDELADVKSDLAVVFHSQGKYMQAISLFNEVYQMDLKAGDKRNQSSSLNNIGRMYIDWKKYETGLEYYKQSIILLDTIADREVLGIRFNNIGMVYQLMDKHREAINWFEKARKIDEQANNPIRLGIRYFNIGNSYLALHDYPNAEMNLEKSLTVFKDSHMSSRLSKVYGSLGELNKAMGNDSKAEEYLHLSLKMALEGENIPELSESYAKLYAFYKHKGDYQKALEYFELVSATEDSIYNLKAAKQIEELEAQYQNEMKESEINRLENENELKIREISFKNRQRNWAYAGIAFLLIASLLLLALFSTVRRQNRELDRLNKTLNRLFAIISHDLRNASAAYQSSAKVITHHLTNGQPEKLLPIVSEINMNAGNLSSMLENLLHWSVMQLNGIEPHMEPLSVREEVEKVTSLLQADAQLKENKISIDVDLNHLIYCDRESFSIILRNLVGNAIKFTSQGEIAISSKNGGRDTTIIVRDTGCGMSDKMVNDIFHNRSENIRRGTAGEKGTGLGLIMVKEHVERNGGCIVVDSEDGKGTTIEIKFPVFDEDMKRFKFDSRILGSDT